MGSTPAARSASRPLTESVVNVITRWTTVPLAETITAAWWSLPAAALGPTPIPVPSAVTNARVTAPTRSATLLRTTARARREQHARSDRDTRNPGEAQRQRPLGPGVGQLAGRAGPRRGRLGPWRPRRGARASAGSGPRA